MSMLFSCRIPAPVGSSSTWSETFESQPVHEDVAELIAGGDRRVIDHDSRRGPPWLRVIGEDEKPVFWRFVDSEVHGFLHVPNDDPRALSVQGYNSGPECLRRNTFNKRSTERGEVRTLFSTFRRSFFFPISYILKALPTPATKTTLERHQRHGHVIHLRLQ